MLALVWGQINTITVPWSSQKLPVAQPGLWEGSHASHTDWLTSNEILGRNHTLCALSALAKRGHCWFPAGSFTTSPVCLGRGLPKPCWWPCGQISWEKNTCGIFEGFCSFGPSLGVLLLIGNSYTEGSLLSRCLRKEVHLPPFKEYIISSLRLFIQIHIMSSFKRNDMIT